MELKQFTGGIVGTNFYLIGGRYLIDPGGWTEELGEALQAAQETLEAILLTHAHYDHIAGIGRVRKIVPDCPVYLHKKDHSMLRDPEKNMSLWTGERLSFEPHSDFTEVDLSVNDQPVEVIHTPGHTPGSVSFHIPNRGLLFSGDTVFKGSIGRTDLPGGNHQQLLQSIRQKLLPLPEETKLYPGHGPTTTVGEEAKSNPFLS